MKSGRLTLVSPDTWLLIALDKPDLLLMALYVHAVYTMHNKYRHSADRGELRKSIERIILDVPLEGKLHNFVARVINGGNTVNS